MLKRLAVISALWLITSSASAQEPTYYAAIYRKGAEQIVMTAQVNPIPVPARGSVVEVTDGTSTITGRVASVNMIVRRQPGGTVVNRFYVLDVGLR